jgi:uncharacterized peroxidase-related enzyme
MLDDDEAPPDLREMYAHLAPAGTPVDNILRIHSLNPKSLQVHYELYKHLMYGPSDLSRAEREMIAVVVSRVNDCHY